MRLGGGPEDVANGKAEKPGCCSCDDEESCLWWRRHMLVATRRRGNKKQGGEQAERAPRGGTKRARIANKKRKKA